MNTDVKTSEYAISAEYPGVEYFNDEVREGFFVSSMMKRYWAAQIKVLSEIDKVCRKHGIRWFADCGTLLGAVRHGGMIPWDDDMDICMLRKDWLKFFEVAKDELPEDYCVLSIQTESEYENVIGRVVNAHAINYSEAHLKEFFGCPYTVGVDIFPLDDLSEDEEKEERRIKLASDVSDAYTLIESGKAGSYECRSLLSKIENDNHIMLNREGNMLHELRLLTEKLYTMYSSDDASYVAGMIFWVIWHDHKYSKELFANTLYLPFEYISIPVPARYDEFLRIEYKNYMTVYKGGGIHEYPVYKTQEELLKAKNNANPFRFTLTEHDIDSAAVKKTTEQKCFEITELLLQVHDKAEVLATSGDINSAAVLLNKCQTLAISLGTMMENSMKGSMTIVHLLENYCEQVYQASVSWSVESRKILDEKIHETEESVKNYFSNKKKEILFISTKAKWWNGLQPVYEYFCSLSDTNVYVMPVSYIVTDKVLGVSEGERNDGMFLPSSINIVEANEYDIASKHPDIIVTDYPYDNWGMTMDVSEEYYSQNLRNFTDELFFVPCFGEDLPKSENDKAMTSLKVMLEQPATLYSDYVVARTEEIRQCYINSLSSFSGHENYWSEKICVIENIKPEICDKSDPLPEEWKVKSSGRKTLVFGVDGSFLLENRHNAVEKLKEAMHTICESSKYITCIFSPSEDVDSIEIIDSELWKEYISFADSVSDFDNVIIDSDHIVKNYLSGISGYYGTPGVLAHRCRNLGKPVMLMKIL